MKSYMLQNFKRRSVVNRWTPKKNLLWLLNNLPTLYLMSLQFFNRGWITGSRLVANHQFQIIFRGAFPRSFVAKASDAMVFRNYPVTPAITTSLKYWALTNSLSFINDTPLCNVRVVTHKNLTFNRYYCPTPLFLARATRRVLRAVLFKWLTFLPLGWVQWNKRHRFVQQHLYLQRDYHLWKFLNVYYFRIFNL